MTERSNPSRFDEKSLLDHVFGPDGACPSDKPAYTELHTPRAEYRFSIPVFDNTTPEPPATLLDKAARPLVGKPAKAPAETTAKPPVDSAPYSLHAHLFTSGEVTSGKPTLERLRSQTASPEQSRLSRLAIAAFNGRQSLIFFAIFMLILVGLGLLALAGNNSPIRGNSLTIHSGTKQTRPPAVRHSTIHVDHQQ